MSTVSDIASKLEGRYPSQWAEPWDAVGLLVGDPEATVTRVLVTLDATEDAVHRAVEAGAQALVTHHPAFLQPPSRLTPSRASVAFAAATAGVALLAAHTNLDRSPGGAGALPVALGLVPSEPVERGRRDVTVLTSYVPPSSLDAVLQAAQQAGAGRVGLYEGCSFSSQGVGRFLPLPASHPVAGEVGERAEEVEVRVEMTVPPASASRAVDAVRDAHPYEEPVIITAPGSMSRGGARLGRICRIAGGRPLGALAEDAACRLQTQPRVWGDPDTLIEEVAVAGGSGASLLDDLLDSGVQAFITGELRYHDALRARQAGLSLVELGHDASEWPLVPLLAEAVRDAGFDEESLIVEAAGPYWWSPQGG